MLCIFSSILKLNYFLKFSVEIFKILLPYIGGIITIVVLEYIWLMHIVDQFIIKQFWNLITVKDGWLHAEVVPWVLAWFFIVGMWYIFVIRSGYAVSYSSALLYGTIIWGLTYGIYDLTNLAFIKNYPIIFSYIDIAWGAFLWASVCLSMYYISTKLS